MENLINNSAKMVDFIYLLLKCVYESTFYQATRADNVNATFKNKVGISIASDNGCRTLQTGPVWTYNKPYHQ